MLPTFQPTSGVGTYAHHIDYPNGRVVFDTAISTTSEVTAEFSYKQVKIVRATDDFFREVQYRSERADEDFTLAGSGDWSQLSETRLQLPVIAIEVLKGRNNISGEWGHVTLPNRSDDEKKYVKDCYCGKNGCMETYVSGPGFASCFNLKHKTNYDSHAILEEFRSNDQRAIEALNIYVDHLARGLSLVCNILDPDIIVLGGGMSNISYIYDHINTSLKKYIFSDTFNTKIIKNLHGDSGGVRGAAWLA